MINSSEIRKKAEKSYGAVLSSFLTGENLFPLTIKGNKGRKESLGERIQGMKELYNNSREKKGFGYELETETRNSRREGEQTTISRIFFSDRKNYLQFLGKSEEFDLFTQAVKLFTDFDSRFREFFTEKPLKILPFLPVFDKLLLVLSWFRENPHCNLYIRELPIEVHTKFIEENTTILTQLLDILLEGHMNEEESTFEERFGLKKDENFQIYIRFIDEQYSVAGFSELAIPLHEAHKLDLKVKRVFIVENRMTWLTFPRVEESVVLWGQGKGVTKLASLPFIKDAEVWYWGDMDPPGFEILNAFRRAVPHTRSFFMDRETFLNYSQFQVETSPFKRGEPEHLSPEEEEVYVSLFSEKCSFRLEQERVPHKEVCRWVEKRFY